MRQATIDLNADLGEREDAADLTADVALLDFVTSANIACGGHAGDEHSMLRIVEAAVQRGVALGAHPAYPDRVNFGRVAMDLPVQRLEDEVAGQVASLLRIIERHGGRLAHVKPHGALYHAAMCSPPVAQAVARGVIRAMPSAGGPSGPPLFLVGQAGAAALDVWRTMGFKTAAEGFCDRRYEPDGTLRARTLPGALLEDPVEAAAQAVSITLRTGAATLTGQVVVVRADTLCLHSDTPNAVRIAEAVREALQRTGIGVQALAERSPTRPGLRQDRQSEFGQD